jgi:hypothetical protein
MNTLFSAPSGNHDCSTMEKGAAVGGPQSEALGGAELLAERR